MPCLLSIELIVSENGRLSVPNTAALTVETLSALVLSAHSELRGHRLCFARRDEQDDRLIAITDDAELCEAVRRQTSGSAALRLFVSAEDRDSLNAVPLSVGSKRGLEGDDDKQENVKKQHTDVKASANISPSLTEMGNTYTNTHTKTNTFTKERYGMHLPVNFGSISIQLKSLIPLFVV